LYRTNHWAWKETKTKSLPTCKKYLDIGYIAENFDAPGGSRRGRLPAGGQTQVDEDRISHDDAITDELEQSVLHHSMTFQSMLGLFDRASEILELLLLLGDESTGGQKHPGK